MRAHRAIVFAWLLASSSVAAALPPREFTQVRPKLQKQLRDKSPAIRKTALEALRQYPLVDAAKMALPLSTDPEESVRVAALQTLCHLRSDDKIDAWMMTSVKEDRLARNAVLAVALLAAETENPELTALLDKRLKNKPMKAADLASAAADLGGWHDPAAVRALQRLTRLEGFSKSMPLKWAVAEGLIAIAHADTLPPLIDLVERLDGEIRSRVCEHLEIITSARNGTDAQRGKAWWGENRKAFRYPTAEAIAAAAAKPRDEAASYYGIPIAARRVIFVIDISGSMSGERLDSAKKGLIKAIEKLPGKSEFNILVFSSRVALWNSKPLVADNDVKKKASEFVENLVAQGATCTYDALDAAMSLQPESIYLLTDGAPTSGQYVLLDDILGAVRSQNRLLGCSIHTIGVGIGPNEANLELFLKRMAAQNHGQYRKAR
jgi:hypothetical protein